ncbi:DUF1499 domain-containing protein [Fretibacter rubidus]|uniref:DUF1499 domain-containing protein n=1 Tax=Fretibacter rubidus TaxID=570162 RepID=UPI00352A4EBE
MNLIEILFWVVVIVSVTFFLLGLKSQKGKPKGLVDGQLADCGAAPNCVSSEADTQPEKVVPPLRCTMAEAKAAVQATGGIITTDSDDYVSATYMSKLFKFVDDVELRKDGDVVQIRSSSRVGYSDRGMNRKRVAAIRAQLGANLPPEV